MEHNSSDHDDPRTGIRNWLIVTSIAVGFLVWGFFIFFAVGDKGTPVWDYSVVPDVPGESPYSTWSAKEFTGLVSKPVQKDQVVEQHVMEPQPSLHPLSRPQKRP